MPRLSLFKSPTSSRFYLASRTIGQLHSELSAAITLSQQDSMPDSEIRECLHLILNDLELSIFDLLHSLEESTRKEA